MAAPDFIEIGIDQSSKATAFESVSNRTGECRGEALGGYDAVGARAGGMGEIAGAPSSGQSAASTDLRGLRFGLH